MVPGARVTVASAMASQTLDILVCDDESSLREALRQSFQREGHRVVGRGRRPLGDRPREHAALRRRAARHRARTGQPGRLRGLPRASRQAQSRGRDHAHGARQRGRCGPRPRGRGRRLRDQAVPPGRAAQPHPRGAAAGRLGRRPRGRAAAHRPARARSRPARRKARRASRSTSPSRSSRSSTS